ncbi:MAG: hypothetical protein ABFD08_18635 [Syntrophomonas sp.]
MTPIKFIEDIKAMFDSTGNPVSISSLQGDLLEADLLEDNGVRVHNPDGELVFLWSEFEEAVNVMAPGPREAGFYITAINGAPSYVVYGAQLSRPVHEKIAALISILIWTKICRYESGFVMLNG